MNAAPPPAYPRQPRSPREAIRYIWSLGPQTSAGMPLGLCQRFCREAYGVLSDGTPDAVTGWHRSAHRIGAGSSMEVPFGALHRWSGGSAGHGHVAIAGGRGRVWTVDLHGPGWWPSSLREIASWAPSLVYLGTTLDIDGVVVAGDDRASKGRHRR